MALPDWLRPFNRAVTNKVLGPLARHVRPFATVTHTGRRSGKTYQTTVWAFEREGVVAFALTYGKDVDWVRNLLAAGRGSVDLGGDAFDIEHPRVVGDDEGRPHLPQPVRAVVPIIGVHDFLLADRV